MHPSSYISNSAGLLTRLFEEDTRSHTRKSAVSGEKLQFIKPVYPRALQELPQGDAWLTKLSSMGNRCLAGKNSTGVTLWCFVALGPAEDLEVLNHKTPVDDNVCVSEQVPPSVEKMSRAALTGN